MRGVVSIGRFRKKRDKEEREWKELDEKMEAFERAAVADAENHTAESVMEVLAAMNGLNRAMANTPFGRQVAEEQQKRDADFKERYRDVYASAPDLPAARIKYFCVVLQRLWQEMEERGWKDRYSIYDDFCSVYMYGVDRAVSDWCRYDRKTMDLCDEVQSEYPFLQLEITKENMGLLLTETLAQIISICPETGTAEKKDFLWEAVRLFEIYRGILYVFSDYTDEKKTDIQKKEKFKKLLSGFW